MKVSGEYAVPAPPETAYAFLQDPEVLARCMPGCDELVRIGDNEYRMKMKMALASISGLFSGTVRIAEPDPPVSFKLVVEGSGKIGFVKGEGMLNLAGQAEGTKVAYEGEVQVGGTIAAVGQRLLDATAKMIIKKFFDKLAVELSQGPAG
jgi:carbon monoxide dehydrogenase subunit G